MAAQIGAALAIRAALVAAIMEVNCWRTLAETAIEVNHTYEPLQCHAVIGFREIQNDLNVVLEGSLAGSEDAVSQEEFGDGERALLQVEGQPDGGEDGEERLELLPVVLLYTPSSSKKEKP
jgi:hypothetical protein